MKREIKFRAWHTGAKEMLYPQHNGVTKQSHVFSWFEEGQPVEIMQFTGLKDKNGKEIYEGDIVSCADVIVAVTWKDAGFHIITNESQGASMFVQDRAKHFEVIGNIYSNPELL